MASVPQGSRTTGINGAPRQDIVPLAANTYIRNDSGRFLTEASGNYALTVASDTQIDAWGEDCFQILMDGNQGATPYPTRATYADAAYMTTVSLDKGIRFAQWLPVYTGETLIAGNVNLLCDLAVSGSTTAAVQYVRPSVTTNKHVKIVAVDLINNYALVYANV